VATRQGRDFQPRIFEVIRQRGTLVEACLPIIAASRAAQAENQRLRDQLNRLKGEQGAPAIKANTPQPPSKDHS